MDSLGKGTLSRSTKKYDYFPETGKYAFRKDANPKAPDYLGRLTLAIDGVEVKVSLSGWVRRGQEGKPGFLSISAEYDKHETHRLTIHGKQAEPAKHDTQEDAQQFDEDLPF